MSKVRLITDKRVGAVVHIYHDPGMTQFSCNPEDITAGSSAGPVRCVGSVRVLVDEVGPFCYVSAEEQAALSAAGLLA